MQIREVIVVEGRDDESAVKAAVVAETIATHGYGVSAATFQRIKKAMEGPGIIIFTDPDHAGEQIRKRLETAFPEAGHAFLPRQEAEREGDIGIENATPESIRAALKKVRIHRKENVMPNFSGRDMLRYGLSGTNGAAERRAAMGKALGIGYGNSAAFLRRLNAYEITREEFEQYGQALFPDNN